MSKSLSIGTTLEYDKVSFGKKHVIHMLVNLEGRKIDIERKPLDLSAVIDCSGSMTGDKLDYAKKTLTKLIENLTSEDSLGVACYADQVWKLFDRQRMTADAKQKAKAQVEQLHTLGCTNLSGGMVEGFEMLKTGDSELVRQFLMTDGLANVGVVDHPAIIKLVENRPKGSSLTTFGYGANHDPELLLSLAKTGKGNFYFVNTPDECPKFFGRELGGLLSCVAQNIKIKVKAKKDVKLVEVLNDFDVDANKEQTEATISVDDVYSEETRHVIVKVELPEMDKAARPFKFADIEVEYHDLKSGEKRTESTSAKVVYVKEKDAQKEANKVVAEQIALVSSAKAQEEALKRAKAGDYAGAQGVLRSAVLVCSSLGTAKGQAMAKDIQSTMGGYSSAEELTAGGMHAAMSNAASYRSGRGTNAGTAGLFAHSGSDSMAKKFMDPGDGGSGGGKVSTSPPVLSKKEDPQGNVVKKEESQKPLSKRRNKR